MDQCNRGGGLTIFQQLPIGRPVGAHQARYLDREGNEHDPGLFTLSAQAEPGKLDAVRDTLLATVENLGTKPFTQEEVDKAKVRSRRNAENMQSNATAMSQAFRPKGFAAAPS